MTKDKLIGSTYVNIIKNENGEIKFAYGYEMNDEELSLNDLAMLNSFLDKIKAKAEEDFKIWCIKNKVSMSEKLEEVIKEIMKNE